MYSGARGGATDTPVLAACLQHRVASRSIHGSGRSWDRGRALGDLRFRSEASADHRLIAEDWRRCRAFSASCVQRARAKKRRAIQSASTSPMACAGGPPSAPKSAWTARARPVGTASNSPSGSRSLDLNVTRTSKVRRGQAWNIALERCANRVRRSARVLALPHGSVVYREGVWPPASPSAQPPRLAVGVAVVRRVLTCVSPAASYRANKAAGLAQKDVGAAFGIRSFAVSKVVVAVARVRRRDRPLRRLPERLSAALRPSSLAHRRARRRRINFPGLALGSGRAHKTPPAP